MRWSSVPLFQAARQPKLPTEMRKANVAMQRLQSGHEDFCNAPVQPLPDQHRRSQVANQNGRQFPKSLTEQREAFVRWYGRVGCGSGAM